MRRVRRVLYEDDPREQDWLDMAKEVESIRSDLVGVRSRLDELGRRETGFWFDSICVKVAGSLTLAIMALHELVVGERSFKARAEHTRELWDRAAADPDGFMIEPGTSQEADKLRSARNLIERTGSSR